MRKNLSMMLTVLVLFVSGCAQEAITFPVTVEGVYPDGQEEGITRYRVRAGGAFPLEAYASGEQKKIGESVYAWGIYRPGEKLLLVKAPTQDK